MHIIVSFLKTHLFWDALDLHGFAGFSLVVASGSTLIAVPSLVAEHSL